MAHFYTVFSAASNRIIHFGCILLFVVIPLFTNGQSSSDAKSELILSMTNCGVEAIRPNPKFGYKAKNTIWIGPSLDLFGFCNLNYQQGYFTKPDSGRVVNLKGSRYSFNINFPMPLTKYKNFNLIPHLGVGVYGHMGTDPNHAESGRGDGGFGFNANLGLSVLLGPVKIGARYYFEGGFNNPGSIFAGAKAVPSIFVGISPQKALLNPKLFSYRGMATWAENYKRDVKTTIKTETIYSDNYGNSIDKTTTTTTVKESWDQVFGEKSAKVMDVQPFFFLGPRLQTGIANFGADLFPSYGLMAGYRIGTIYFAGHYDKGSFYFKENFDRGHTDEKSSMPLQRVPRMDGYFVNSSRWGVEGGIDLVTYFIKSQFLDKSSFVSRTSYYGLIIRGGIIRQTNGDVRFNSDSGSIALNKELANGSVYNPKSDVRLLPKHLKGANFGLTGSVGASAFNIDYYFFESNSMANHWEFSLSYHMPVVRLVKAGYILAKQVSLNRRLRKQREAAEKSQTP
ncbi:MAG TPA: hypothetical protein PK509_03160 [Catalimonadaceae bacterium]|nr:hypothetical protein [Catalimonadaceae bacterium]